MERAKEHEMVETRPEFQLITLAFERLLIEEREKRYNRAIGREKMSGKWERFMLTFRERRHDLCRVLRVCFLG
jgi:hypothetical protein